MIQRRGPLRQIPLLLAFTFLVLATAFRFGPSHGTTSTFLMKEVRWRSSTLAPRNYESLVALHASTADALNDWVISQGSKKEDIKVSIENRIEALPSGFDISYTVGIAKSALKTGEVMYTFPMGACLDAKKAANKFGNSELVRQLRTGELGMIALLLLAERADGEKSIYSSYIQALPATAPGVLNWSDAELLQCYQSTTRQIQRQVAAVDRDVEVIQSSAAAGKLSMIPPEALTAEAFRWAMGVVKARNVIVDDRVMLVPGIDSIQYKPEADNEPYSAGAGMFGGKVVKVQADRDYSAGEEVAVSFGLKSCAECLEDHGIVPFIDLTDSSCEITISITDQDKFSGDKELILEDNDFGSTGRFDLEADSITPIDPDLIRFLRLKLINGTDAFILEPVFSNTVFSTMREPFSKGNELAVYRYLQSYCNNALERINSVASIEADTTATASASKSADAGGDRGVLMARLRLQERAALEETLRKTREEIDVISSPVDPREYYQERRLLELNLLRPLDEGEVVMPGDRLPLDDDYSM